MDRNRLRAAGSITLGQATTSPFAIFARVHDGKITEWLFIEDTFATARTFRSGGTWSIQAEPDGPTIEV